MLILTILKVIIIIILIIIGIILLIAAYSLLLPISYNLSSDFDKQNFAIRVFDILRIVSFTLRYNQNKLSYKISLFFGIKKITSLVDNKKGEKKSKRNKTDKNKKKKKEKSKKNKINYKEALFDSSNRKTISYIIKELFKTLNKLKPRVFRANINYSLGEPDKTGILTGGLSLLSFIYDKKNKIYPDFEADYAYISGKLKIKGNIRLIWFVALFFRLYSKAFVRRFLQKLL